MYVNWVKLLKFGYLTFLATNSSLISQFEIFKLVTNISHQHRFSLNAKFLPAVWIANDQSSNEFMQVFHLRLNLVWFVLYSSWQIQTFCSRTLNKHAKILNIYIVSINSHIWKFSSLFCSPIRGIFAAWNFLMTLKSRILDTYRHHYRNFLPTLSKIQYIERMKYLADRW